METNMDHLNKYVSIDEAAFHISMKKDCSLA